MAGLTKAQRAEKDAAFEDELAVRKAQLQGRQGNVRSRNVTKSHTPVLRKGGNGEKVEFIMKKFIDQLIDENCGKGLLEVDFTNKDMVQRRKDQMGIIRDHINLIKQLKDVRMLLIERDADSDDALAMTAENVVLIDEAKELLAKKGIKADF